HLNVLATYIVIQTVNGNIVKYKFSMIFYTHSELSRPGKPANISFSGKEVDTRVCANSNSSVGHKRACVATEVAKNAPAGSICVACARRASSRFWKKSAHSI